MKSEWNRSEIKLDFPNAKTLGDLIHSVEDQLKGAGEVVCSIRVNGMSIQEADEEKFQTCAISEVESFGVSCAAVPQLLRESIDSASQYIVKLRETSYRTADLMRSDDLSAACKNFEAVLGGLQWSVEMLTEIRRAAMGLEPWAHSAEARRDMGSKWEECQRNFLRRTEQVLAAFEKRDFILVADLLEYDMTAIMENWEGQLKAILRVHGRNACGMEKPGTSSLVG